MQKRLRSTTGRQTESSKAKSTTKTVDDPLKKARARPALSFANILCSQSQPASNTRGTSALAKNTTTANANPPPTRRSNRLQSGSGAKQLHLNKVRDDRVPAEHQLMFSSTLLQHEIVEDHVINPASPKNRIPMARLPSQHLLGLNCLPLQRLRGPYNRSSRHRKSTSTRWRTTISTSWSASSHRLPGD